MKICKTCEEEKAQINGECYLCHFQSHEFDEPTNEERKIQNEERRWDLETNK